MDLFPVKLPLRIDWSEIDLFGHVNNVAYFKYVQASRVNYWEQMGLVELHGGMSAGPMLASTGCRFRKPLFYPGHIVVQARVDFIRHTSFGLHHQVLDADGEVAAEAQDVVVMFDFTRNEKIPIPLHLRETIERIQREAPPETRIQL
jgi:acyl-CoA thioester hydrolase